MNDFDKGWLIGILEGEGTFGYYNKCVRLAVEMADADVVIRVAELLGEVCDTTFIVRERPKHHRVHQENWSTLYRLQVTGQKAKTIMRFIVRDMSARRRVKIWQALNNYAPAEGPLKADDLLKLVVNNK